MTRVVRMMGGIVAVEIGTVQWHRVDDHKPPQNTLVMVTGDSGYRTHTRYLTLAYVDEEYRPSLDGRPRWINVQNDGLSDQFPSEPTHWAHMMELP